MKVSTKLFNEQQIRQFSSLNGDIQKLQEKISSGKNIIVASDDPIGSVDLSGYKTVKNQIDQYMKNVNSAQTRLSLVDTNLQNLSTVMIRANELPIKTMIGMPDSADSIKVAIWVLSPNSAINIVVKVVMNIDEKLINITITSFLKGPGH